MAELIWCWKKKFKIPIYMCERFNCKYHLINGGICSPEAEIKKLEK
ncbi:hypothetical protein [Ferroglobus sp.]|nr:hypothetical protein [Ferroglobus sp.]